MCNCIEEVNKKLESITDNTILDIPFSFGFDGKIRVDRIQIKTMKRDEKSKKKPVSVQPSYCPFCGQGYKDS